MCKLIIITIFYFLYSPSFLFAQNDSNIDSVLFKIIEENNVKALDSLLQLGVEVNITNKDGESPLMVACKGYDSNEEIVQLLINNDADIFYSNKNIELSALSLSIKYLNTSISELLLSHASDEQKNKVFNDLWYIFECIYSGDHKTFKLIFPYYKNKVSEKFLDETMLESAIDLECTITELFSVPISTEGKKRLNMDASILILETLIKSGANIDQKSYYDIPVIFKSVCSARGLRFLIENGANVNAIDDSHDMSYSILEAFIDQISKPNFTIGQEVVFLDDKKQYYDHLDLLDLMILKGAKLKNGYNNSYQYLLAKAVSERNSPLINILLNKEIDFNFIDLEGKTLLMRAQETEDTEIIDLLIEKGIH